VRLLLLAPPGAGKGTQGERLAAWSGVRHIAAGDLLRGVVRAGGPLGTQIAACQARGDLVPDQIVLDVLTPAVADAAARGGYILDGFPRTLPQAAAAAAEGAARQGRFWDMHELLFRRQKELDDSDLVRYAAQMGLVVERFDTDRASSAVLERIRRDVASGLASGQVLGTPTLFIDGVVYRGGYDPPTLLAALTP